MTDLDDLYQEVIIDHAKNPRGYGPMPGADRVSLGHNPLCGDRLALALRLDGSRISEARFEGSGCAISTASASLMTAALKNTESAAARALADSVIAMATGKEHDPAKLGKLAALAGVREFPARVKCATLAWHALIAALESKPFVSTEGENDPVPGSLLP